MPRSSPRRPSPRRSPARGSRRRYRGGSKNTTIISGRSSVTINQYIIESINIRNESELHIIVHKLHYLKEKLSLHHTLQLGMRQKKGWVKTFVRWLLGIQCMSNPTIKSYFRTYDDDGSIIYHCFNDNRELETVPAITVNRKGVDSINLHDKDGNVTENTDQYIVYVGDTLTAKTQVDGKLWSDTFKLEGMYIDNNVLKLECTLITT